jgi:2-methylcitrate dehydratase PrpD
LRKFVDELGGKSISSVVGHGFKTSVVNAALANGTMGYTCDVEPHHPEGCAAPDRRHDADRSRGFGDDWSVGCRLRGGGHSRLRDRIPPVDGLGPVEQYNLGFHPSAVCGCFGATAAAAFLLHLDQGQVTKAFGLAGCQASGLMAWESDETETRGRFRWAWRRATA